jgi:hypothetical protein
MNANALLVDAVRPLEELGGYTVVQGHVRYKQVAHPHDNGFVELSHMDAKAECCFHAMKRTGSKSPPNLGYSER